MSFTFRGADRGSLTQESKSGDDFNATRMRSFGSVTSAMYTFVDFTSSAAMAGDEIVANVVGVITALHSTLILMSVQPLWYIIHAPPQLFGLFVSTFEIFQIISIFATVYLSKYIKSYSPIIAFLLTLLTIGALGQAWIFFFYNPVPYLFIFRAIQGLSGGLSIIGAICIYQIPSINPTLTLFNNYTSSQMDAKQWWAPLFCGFLFFTLPAPHDFIFYFSLWGFYWNVFSLSTGVYHITQYQSELWKAYIPIGIGGVFGAVFNFERLLQPFSRYRMALVDDPHMVSMVAGCLTLAVSFLIIATNYRVRGEPVQYPFYISAAFTGLAMVWYCRSSVEVIRRFLIEYETYHGQIILSACSSSIAGCGRVFGALFASSLLEISGREEGSDTYDCPSDPNSYSKLEPWYGCCISPRKFYVENCHVQYVRVWATTCLAMLCCGSVICVCYALCKRTSYADCVRGQASQDVIEDIME
eukprot:gene6283-12724_t